MSSPKFSTCQLTIGAKLRRQATSFDLRPARGVSFSDLLSGFLCQYAQILADFKHWDSGPLPSNHNQSIHEDENGKISL
jgi:hypothetical protein